MPLAFPKCEDPRKISPSIHNLRLLFFDPWRKRIFKGTDTKISKKCSFNVIYKYLFEQNTKRLSFSAFMETRKVFPIYETVKKTIRSSYALKGTILRIKPTSNETIPFVGKRLYFAFGTQDHINEYLIICWNDGHH